MLRAGGGSVLFVIPLQNGIQEPIEPRDEVQPQTDYGLQSIEMPVTFGLTLCAISVVKMTR
jgi:hypothetical protein